MKDSAEVTEGRAENEREERDGREKKKKLIYIILFCKYIILMSKRRK